MARMSALVIVMESLAVLFAVLLFGRPVLIIGGPALVATILVLVAVQLAERRRIRREQAVAAVPTVPGGLMSGFFRLPTQPVPVDVPERSRP